MNARHALLAGLPALALAAAGCVGEPEFKTCGDFPPFQPGCMPATAPPTAAPETGPAGDAFAPASDGALPEDDRPVGTDASLAPDAMSPPDAGPLPEDLPPLPTDAVLPPPADGPFSPPADGDLPGDQGAGGAWPDALMPPPPDAAPGVCLDGETRSRPCGGLNARGQESNTCEDGAWGEWSACVDPDECVDGRVEPCPGGTDEGPCERGTRTCVAGSWADCAGAIAPRAEVCNGEDDDCDGAPDSGEPCGGGNTCVRSACYVQVSPGGFTMGSPIPELLTHQ